MTDFTTSDRDVNRAIRSWLREDRHEDVSRLAGAVLTQVETIPQRRATWWPTRRTPTMNRFVTLGLGAAAVVVVLLIGAQLLGLPGGGVGSGDPTATPEPTAAVTPSPSNYTRAEQKEILLRESVHLAYGTGPHPDWSQYFDSVSVGREGRADILARLAHTQSDLAERMCHDIAAVAFDDEAQPIGLTDLQVVSALNEGEVLAKCHVPELP